MLTADCDLANLCTLYVAWFVSRSIYMVECFCSRFTELITGRITLRWIARCPSPQRHGIPARRPYRWHTYVRSKPIWAARNDVEHRAIHHPCTHTPRHHAVIMATYDRPHTHIDTLHYLNRPRNRAEVVHSIPSNLNRFMIDHNIIIYIQYVFSRLRSMRETTLLMESV